jgi:hypothetical protein
MAHQIGSGYRWALQTRCLALPFDGEWAGRAGAGQTPPALHCTFASAASAFYPLGSC